MRNPAKAILVAVLIAIPAPFILGSCLPPLRTLRLLAIGEGLEALPGGGIAAYIIAFVLFAVAGFLATPSAVATANTPAAKAVRPVPASLPTPTMTTKTISTTAPRKATKRAPSNGST